VKNLLCILCTFFFNWCGAQLPDSLQTDSNLLQVDSLLVLPVQDTISRDSIIKDSIYHAEWVRFSKSIDTSIYSSNPFFRFTNPIRQLVVERKWQGKEDFFYAIAALLLFFAFLKNAFSRYQDDLLKVFFRTTLKQRQTREQLMNAPLPSLLFNVLYALSAGLFITLLLYHFGFGTGHDFWILFTYCIAGLLLIYTLKFVTLKICGWMLRATDATDTYIFIVFTTNKIIGIVLLPFVIGLAFISGQFYETVLFLSLCILAALFAYRFYLSYVSVRKGIKINFFHFLLYLLAFEIVPLLLINKVLVRFFSETS